MYTFLQMTAYIGGISAIITTLYKFGANHRILKAALGAYALFHVFPLYAIMVGGDSFFALFFLLFMVGILWIFKTQGDVLKNIKFDIFFCGNCFSHVGIKESGNLYCLSYFSFLCDLSEKIQNKNISDNVCSDIYFPVCLYRTAF